VSAMNDYLTDIEDSLAVAEPLQIHASGFELHRQDTIEPCEHTDKMPEIYSLHFLRVPSPEHGAWAASGFAWCRPADESVFASAVARKKKKLYSYRASVPTIWLVVVELFEAGELISARFHSRFDRPLRDPDAVRPRVCFQLGERARLRDSRDARRTRGVTGEGFRLAARVAPESLESL
jgi:hypothetical protein